ncbi:MAG TPA: orotidine-5'-phosphate decarboxylase [Firmicutes bacterium]|nr:orotidine-5'-phosphate decarboxylase [Bacillota bacterium]
MQSFAKRLAEAIRAKQSPLVIGLDPDLTKFPPALQPAAEQDREAAARAILTFNRAIIDATWDLAPAVKPQAAFYERYGWAGIKALEETVSYARQKGLLVLLDAKRGDVPNTAQAYAQAYLTVDGEAACPVDALTVNPYLGRDSVEPFVQTAAANGKGVFVLVRTSNPGAGDLQDLTAGQSRRPLWQEVAGWVADWARHTAPEEGYSPVGIVAGITYPEEAGLLRRLLPHSYLLLPGVGAQGGQAADALPCFDSEGLGALVVAARSVIYAFRRPAYQERFVPDEFAAAARQAVQDLLQELGAAGYKVRR